MTFEIAVTHRPSWIKRTAQYLREQYELDVLRSKIRKERNQLAEMTDSQLRDIGITPEQAAQEASRGYTDIPSHRHTFMTFCK